MASATARSAVGFVLLVALAAEGKVDNKFWGFLDDVAGEGKEKSDATTVAEILEHGGSIQVEDCGQKTDVMRVTRTEFYQSRLQVRAYGNLSRSVSGGIISVKIYKSSAAKGSSTGDWMKRELAWHSIPHNSEEDLCKHFGKSHSQRGCPLPAGKTELRFAIDKLPPMVVAGSYKLKIKAVDAFDKQVACVRAHVEIPRGKSGELFRRVQGVNTAHRGRALESAPGDCPCDVSDPVCGNDGNTYDGICHAHCAKVDVAYSGTCVGEVVSPDGGAVWVAPGISPVGEDALDVLSEATARGGPGRSRRLEPEACVDTSEGAVGAPWGYFAPNMDCHDWASRPSYCGFSPNSDDSDFTALDMCCGCGGGTTTMEAWYHLDDGWEPCADDGSNFGPQTWNELTSFLNLGLVGCQRVCDSHPACNSFRFAYLNATEWYQLYGHHADDTCHLINYTATECVPCPPPMALYESELIQVWYFKEDCSVPVPAPACQLDLSWCDSFYEYVDCDGDDLEDHYCKDIHGNSGVIGSASTCSDTWPSGTCASQESACVDTSEGAVGGTLTIPDGEVAVDCLFWSLFWSSCPYSPMYDDSDFTAIDMCCGCGGGANDAPVGTTEPGPEPEPEMMTTTQKDGDELGVTSSVVTTTMPGPEPEPEMWTTTQKDLDDSDDMDDCGCDDMDDEDYFWPVCGNDGTTYSNTCYAECLGGGVWMDGECDLGVDAAYSPTFTVTSLVCVSALLQ